MGGFNGGGGGDENPPVVPIPDHVVRGKMEEIGRQQAGSGGYWGGIAQWVFEHVIIWLISGIVDVIDRLMVVVGQAALAAQGEQSPEFIRLVGTMMGDLLGIELNLDDFSNAVTQRGRIGGMNFAGEKLFQELEKEFAPAGGLDETQGRAAATTFMGFLMSFAVREGNIATLIELLSANYMSNFRDIGVEMAQNLGLGRLARMAFRPLIETVVGTPLQWSLNSKYRPTVLGETLAVKANIRGHMSDDRLQRDLKRKGYTDEDILTLLAENTPSLTLAQVYTQHRWGNIDEQAMMDKAKDLGYPASIAGLLLQDLDLSRAENEVTSYVSKLKTLYTDGFIDHDTFVLKLREVPLVDIEQQFILKTVALDIEYPSKRMTYAQLKSAFVAGIVDLDYVQFWLSAEHYDPDSITYLTYEILLAADKAAQAKALAEAKAAKAAASSTPPPQTP